MSRGPSGSIFNARVKVTFKNPNMAVDKIVAQVLLGRGENQEVFAYSQGLSEDSDVIAVSPVYSDAKASHFDIYLSLDLFQLSSNSTNKGYGQSVVEFVGGTPYFVELQLAKPLSDGRQLRECVRVNAVYTGLAPAPESTSSDCASCDGNSTSQTVVNNHYVTNTYTTAAGSNISQFNVGLFGAVGDGSHDDTMAVQAAINAAEAVGGTVLLPPGRFLTTDALVVPAGVSIRGEGQGRNPRDMSGLLGSVVYYRGLDAAIRVTGDLVGLSDFSVYDAGASGGSASVGVLVDADGRFIESIHMHNLLIFRFTNGTGLKLFADHGGAVAYSSFYDVRVRNAKVGIHLHATGAQSSFVNSNSFYRGAVSGGGFDYCLKLEGPGANNNNIFEGIVLEPYVSTYGHIHVTGAMTQLQGLFVRVEALQQPENVPMVHFGPETYGSHLSGLFSAGLVTGNRLAHELDIATGKFVGASFSNDNDFDNPSFRGVSSATGAVPGWTLTTTGGGGLLSNVSVSNAQQLLERHNVLRLIVPAGATTTLKPAVSPRPAMGSLYRTVSFGMYVRHVTTPPPTATSRLFASFDTSETAVTTSGLHPADSDAFHFVSMVGAVPTSPAGAAAPIALFPVFVFENSGAGPLHVEFSCPSFAWGEQTPQLESGSVRSAGGTMDGTLSTAVATVVPPTSGNYYTLPKDGNTFIFDSASYTFPTIIRLNHDGENRFPRGTVITLLFLGAGVSVSDSVYINIAKAFTSTAHCSLTLLALDAGTWVELSRYDGA